MIKENTLFILGSGASWPYGYPTGEILIKEIRDYFPLLFKKLSVAEKKEANYSLAKEFVDELMRSHDNMIDYFLATSKPENAAIGKMAILATIHWKEKLSAQREITGIVEDDWFQYLIKCMTKSLITRDSIKNFGNNKVNFITFNYDRLLEHFLGNMTQNKYSIERSYVKDYLCNINILHVYGRLPLLPWEDIPTGIEYGYEIDLDYLIHNWDRIKTIHERSEINQDSIDDLVKKAERIFFLGFGFHEENIKTLKLETNIWRPISIYATAFKNNDEQIERIKTNLCPDIIRDGSQFGIRVKKIIEPIRSRELLEKYL